MYRVYCYLLALIVALKFDVCIKDTCEINIVYLEIKSIVRNVEAEIIFGYNRSFIVTD
jgi:hypothetical protein